MSTVEDFQATTPPGGHMALCHRQQAIDFICTLGIGDVRKCRCLHSIQTLTEGEREREKRSSLSDLLKMSYQKADS